MSQVETNLLLKMAQQAGRDDALLACQIEALARKQPGGWAGVAEALLLDETRLARLALCRRPQAPNFEAEARQIAALVGVEPDALQTLFTSSNPRPLARDHAPTRKPAAAWRFSAPVGAGGLAALALVILVVFLALSAPAAGSQATLVIQQGRASVQAGSSGLAWLTAPREQVVASGQMLVVKAGDQIRLSPGASGQVRFYDGSLVELSDQAQLTIQTLNTSPERYQVELRQVGGVTLNRVMRLLGVNDFFQIRTPSSTVSVRGTEFVVQVISTDASRVVVTKGVVHVAAGSQAVDVHPGEQALAVRGEAPQLFNQGEPLPIETPPLHLPGIKPDPANPQGPQPVPPDVSANDPSAGVSAPGEPAPGIAAPGGATTSSSAASGDPGKQVPGNPPADPPGQGQPPAGGAEPPGQVKVPPGQVKEPPGQSNEPPGQSNEPPGQIKEPPGQIKDPPGQTK